MNKLQQDRRSRKTEAAIEKAFIELVSKKDINKITVRDVAEQADTNRGTFYLHYLDMVDLQDRVENTIIDELCNSASKNVMVTFKDNRIMNITRALEYIQQNVRLFRAFLDSSQSMRFLDKLNDAMEEKLFLNVKFNFSENDTEFRRMLTMFFVNGSISVIRDWLDAENAVSPAEMAAVLETILNRGLAGFTQD